MVLHANKSPATLLALANACRMGKNAGMRPPRPDVKLFAEHKLPCRLYGRQTGATLSQVDSWSIPLKRASTAVT